MGAEEREGEKGGQKGKRSREYREQIAIRG